MTMEPPSINKERHIQLLHFVKSFEIVSNFASMSMKNTITLCGRNNYYAHLINLAAYYYYVAWTFRGQATINYFLHRQVYWV